MNLNAKAENSWRPGQVSCHWQCQCITIGLLQRRKHFACKTDCTKGHAELLWVQPKRSRITFEVRDTIALIQGCSIKPLAMPHGALGAQPDQSALAHEYMAIRDCM